MPFEKSREKEMSEKEMLLLAKPNVQVVGMVLWLQEPRTDFAN